MTVGVPAGAVMCTACDARLTADPSGLCNRCKRGAPVPAQAPSPDPLASAHVAPPPRENPLTLMSLGQPVIAFTVHGIPGTQGSKDYMGHSKGGDGRRPHAILKESSHEKVQSWRGAVRQAFLAVRPADWAPLDGPVVLDLVVTLYRPKALPKMLRVFPIKKKDDVDKLQRSTLDALGEVSMWGDDGQVVGYRRMLKLYAGDPDPDALPAPGAVIRAWVLPREPLT